MWSEKSDFRKLLTADQVRMNGRLAKLPASIFLENALFQKVTMPAGDQAGLPTHPYLMATFAYSGTSSPIHRGVFLSRGVLGISLRPPQDAFTPLAEELHPKLTTRERVTLQMKPGRPASGLPRRDQPARLHARELRRDRPISTEENAAKPVDSAGSFVTRAATRSHSAARRSWRSFSKEDEVQGGIRCPTVPSHRETAGPCVRSRETEGVAAVFCR